MSASHTQNPVLLNVEEAYARWAPSYDETPNPLLALEERLLTPILNNFAHCSMVDLGCGTGRWLQQLESAAPRSLVGIDSSPAMLAEAAKKCLPSTALVRADCTATPLPACSADCALASFLLSYVKDLPGFAAEAARILRSCGTLIVSDLHPRTFSYGWRRTFKTTGDLFEIATFNYSIADLTSTLANTGFMLEEMRESSFGKEEEIFFSENGMLDQFRQVDNLPVIYWARFALAER